ncbi:DUF6876 family protein [Chryseobacterium sp. CT-SW4]|uniref:DUF6876 family protein n=1 Tax=Chryseobacterium sp. SW-1 TaxID=3157343 RepID=UPI003B026AD5
MSNKRNSNIKNSANDLYDIYTTEKQLYEYKMGIKLSEGVNDIATYEDCFWLIDLIYKDQPKLNSQPLIYELEKVEENNFTLKCFYENGVVVSEQNNLKVSFYFEYLQIVRKGKILCLPIENSLY